MVKLFGRGDAGEERKLFLVLLPRDVLSEISLLT